MLLNLYVVSGSLFSKGLAIGINDGSYQGVGYTGLIVMALAAIILLGPKLLWDWLPRWLSHKD